MTERNGIELSNFSPRESDVLGILRGAIEPLSLNEILTMLSNLYDEKLGKSAVGVSIFRLRIGGVHIERVRNRKGVKGGYKLVR